LTRAPSLARNSRSRSSPDSRNAQEAGSSRCIFSILRNPAHPCHAMSMAIYTLHTCHRCRRIHAIEFPARAEPCWHCGSTIRARARPRFSVSRDCQLLHVLSLVHGQRDLPGRARGAVYLAAFVEGWPVYVLPFVAPAQVQCPACVADPQHFSKKVWGSKGKTFRKRFAR
jgi:hypothetical protein